MPLRLDSPSWKLRCRDLSERDELIWEARKVGLTACASNTSLFSPHLLLHYDKGDICATSDELFPHMPITPEVFRRLCVEYQARLRSRFTRT